MHSGAASGAASDGTAVFASESGVEALVRLRGRRMLLRFAGSVGASSVAFSEISPDPVTAIRAITGSGLDAGQVGGALNHEERAFDRDAAPRRAGQPSSTDARTMV